jgi:hypothetical protein
MGGLKLRELGPRKPEILSIHFRRIPLRVASRIVQGNRHEMSVRKLTERYPGAITAVQGQIGVRCTGRREETWADNFPAMPAS